MPACEGRNPPSTHDTALVPANPGGATLGGTLTATAVKGVATFTGVTISVDGGTWASSGWVRDRGRKWTLIEGLRFSQ